MTRSLAPVLVLMSVAAGRAAELRPQTAAAFDNYVKQAETRIRAQISAASGFLCANTPERRAKLRGQEVISEARSGSGENKVDGGLIHDWVGAVFIPGASISRVLTMVQDYDHHKDVYRPEVLDSRLLNRTGDDFRITLRLFKQKVISVVLNSEHAVHYEQLSSSRWTSRSVSTRIAEVENPGKPDEKELPPGRDHGFLWRLNSYWTFQELDGGTYVECEAISLARNIPRGLGWLIGPIIRELPRQSLANTLTATRSGVVRLSSDQNRRGGL